MGRKNFYCYYGGGKSIPFRKRFYRYPLFQWYIDYEEVEEGRSKEQPAAEEWYIDYEEVEEGRSEEQEKPAAEEGAGEDEDGNEDDSVTTAEDHQEDAVTTAAEYTEEEEEDGKEDDAVLTTAEDHQEDAVTTAAEYPEEEEGTLKNQEATSEGTITSVHPRFLSFLEKDDSFFCPWNWRPCNASHDDDKASREETIMEKQYMQFQPSFRSFYCSDVSCSSFLTSFF